MNLSQARTYIKNQIALHDSSLKEWKDTFNRDNVPSSMVDNHYHISFGSLTSAQRENYVEDNWTTVVTIWKRGFTNPVNAFDAIMDTANCIRMSIIQPEADTLENILSVESVSIEPEPIDDTNDNIIMVSLEFNMRLIFYTT